MQLNVYVYIYMWHICGIYVAYMYIYVCVYVQRIYVFTGTSICVHKNVCILCVYICAYLSQNRATVPFGEVYMYINFYVYVYTWVYVYVYIYAYTNICICVHMYVRVCVRT